MTYHNPDEDAAAGSASKLPKRYSPDASCPINNPYGTDQYGSVHNDTCFWLVSILKRRTSSF